MRPRVCITEQSELEDSLGLGSESYSSPQGWGKEKGGAEKTGHWCKCSFLWRWLSIEHVTTLGRLLKKTNQALIPLFVSIFLPCHMIKFKGSREEEVEEENINNYNNVKIILIDSQQYSLSSHEKDNKTMCLYT